MGCSGEKSVPILTINNPNKKLNMINDDNIELDLNDMEQQGERSHPQKETINDINIIEEPNYYNYNLDDLIPVNTSKMTVKRIEYFDDDESESESEDDKENEREENNEIKIIKEDDNINKDSEENNDKYTLSCRYKIIFL